MTAQPSIAWTTGKAFERQLRASVHVHWQDAPLRDALMRLSRAQRVAVVLDRRFDPGRLTHATSEGLSLHETLTQIGKDNGWNVSVLPGVVYLGPHSTTLGIATWHVLQSERVAQLPRTHRRRWQQTSDGSWPRLTEPQALIVSWTRAAGISIEGTDQIAHDLWPRQDLPSLSLLTRLTVALAGFELAPQIGDEGTVRIVSLPRNVTISRRLQIPRRRIADLGRLRAELPTARLTLRGQILELDGRIEDVRRAQAWLQPKATESPRAPRLADTRFTLTVENQPMGAVLQAVADRLNLEIEWRDETSSMKEQRVTFSVEDATLGKLITTVLGDQPAVYQVKGQRLIISPTSPAR